GRRVTISPFPKNVSERRRMCGRVSGKSIIRPSTEPPPRALHGNGDAEHCVGDFEPQLPGTRAEPLEPERALVEAMEGVLPREADAAVHLDRPLACGDRRLGRERLRCGSRDRRLLVVLR